MAIHAHHYNRFIVRQLEDGQWAVVDKTDGTVVETSVNRGEAESARDRCNTRAISLPTLPARTFTATMAMKRGQEFIVELARSSQWFMFEPLPDDLCEITLKDDEPMRQQFRSFLVGKK